MLRYLAGISIYIYGITIGLLIASGLSLGGAFIAGAGAGLIIVVSSEW